MYRFALVDDDPVFLSEISGYLKKYSEEFNVSLSVDTFENGVRFLESGTLTYDIVLLDIAMPEKDGMEVARIIREKDENITIIFITTIAQQAINGYEVGAKDFIIKPVDYDRFSLRLSRILKHVVAGSKEFAIHTQDGVTKLSLSDIYYVESNQHFSTFHTKKGDLTMRIALKDVEKELSSAQFARCNNSFLVNLKFVTKIKANDVYIDDKYILWMTRGKKDEFMKAFTLFQGGSAFE